MMLVIYCLVFVLQSRTLLARGLFDIILKSQNEWKIKGNYTCFRKLCKHIYSKKSVPIMDNFMVDANIVK